MTTIVVGRGVCPVCGQEGSVVLKEIGGRVYVYVKHGNNWHYVGPLEKIDLTGILRGEKTGDASRTSGIWLRPQALLVLSSIFLFTSCLVTSIGGWGHTCVPLLLSTLGVLTTSTSIALHECNGGSYGVLDRVLKKGFHVYLVFSTLTITVLLIACAFFKCSPGLELKFSAPVETQGAAVASEGFRMFFPLAGLLLVSLAVVLVSRPVGSKTRKIVLAASSLLASSTIIVLVPIADLILVGKALVPALLLLKSALSMILALSITLAGLALAVSTYIHFARRVIGAAKNPL